MSKHILTHVERGVMTITLNRPERKNAITSAMYEVMADDLAAAERDPAVHVVVLQGNELVFSAGNDIGEFLGNPTTGTESPALRFVQGIAAFSKPLIAAVCGPAVGLASTMLLHCDLVYAGDNAVFSMPFVDLGLCPEAASTLLVPQMLGYHRAAQALLLCEPLTAPMALAAGLVNGVVPRTEANAIALAAARKLVAKPLGSLIETKRLMKQCQSAPVFQQMATEGESFSRLLGEPAAKEAFSAFMEKRQPDFTKA